MNRVIIAFALAVCLFGCSADPPKQAPDATTSSVAQHYVTEQNARLISIARSAATAEGFSLADAIYEVRRDDDGWIVQVDRAPGYTGVGEPSVVVDGTFFVKLDSDEQVREILSFGRRIKPTTRPMTRVAEPGMSESEARQVYDPISIDRGVVYWGGSGARRMYWQLDANTQTWVEIGPGPHGCVTEVGPREPKRTWTRHRGDSITVEGM
jgi:hypothetical protein